MRLWERVRHDDVPDASRRLRQRYPLAGSELAWPMPGGVSEVWEAVASGDNPTAWQHPALSLRDDVQLTDQDITDALILMGRTAVERMRAERDLIDMARRRRMSWPQIAGALGLADGRTARQYHQQLLRYVGANTTHQLAALAIRPARDIEGAASA